MSKQAHPFSLLSCGKTLACLITSILTLSACRLSESERYPRLNFSPNQKTLRVLMIGNSLTFYNDLPGILQQLSSRESVPIDIEQRTAPFRSLKGHWRRRKTFDAIRNGHFDFVILQDFSRKPATSPEDSLKYFLLFDEEIRRTDAQTILFQNWTRRGYSADYPLLEKTYHQIQERTGASIAPIGKAWRLCAQSHPDIQLLVDHRHPTPAGSYLAACVLYNTLYHKPTMQLPLTLLAPDLPPATISALRQVADNTSQ